MLRKTVLAIIATLATTPAFAQQWDWQLAPYLWAAGIDGRASIGPANADVSVDFKDIVDILRGGALVRLEASNDRHGFFGDLVYLRLKEKEARDTIGGTLELKLDTLIVEGAYFYRFNERHAVEIGARYWDLETTLRPALFPEVKSTTDWTDAFVGIRTEMDINSDWSWLFRGNVGGGGADFAAGLQLDFRRKFASGNSLDIGLRILDIDYEDTSGLVTNRLNLSFEGLAIGYTFDL